MKLQTYVRRCELPVDAEAAFAWHEQPGAIDRLLPPWENMQVERRTGGLQTGAEVVLVNRLGPLRLRWLAEHVAYQPPRLFEDVQRSGPFAHWDHQHRFTSESNGDAALEDHVEYAVPGGWLGQAVAGGFVRRQLDRMFAYRHETTVADLSLHQRYREKGLMRVAITGCSGLVGSELKSLLTTGGHEVRAITRRRQHEGDIEWDIAAGRIDAEQLEGLDAVVHLAGENIAAGRWNAKQKAKIRDSRVEGTRLLCQTLANLRQKPKVLVAASATGFYGDRGDEVLTEDSPPGDNFLADVCREWEAQTEIARQAGIRVVNLRFGMILSPKDGALKKMLLPAKLGGGRLGSGRQYWSWIGLDDAAGAIHHALMTDSLSGPVNAVSPNPMTNSEFTKVLGRVISRPTILPAPAFGLKLALGQMADQLLLASCRALPERLQQSNYEFRHPTLEGALRFQLGR